ncbi:hypothetical protein [Taklimakanibacter deserti]|uniref:hypothetical protein n=1 Tax=Taklimakanibacter deserti TaxID=2267839 RepID=UPI000E649B80
MMTAPGFFAGAGVAELERNTSWYTRTTSNVLVTSDARPIGTASATRKVYALISAELGLVSPGPAALNSVTIGGISATIEVQHNNGDDIILAIASATVPTGSAAVVVATFSHAVRSVMVHSTRQFAGRRNRP